MANIISIWERIRKDALKKSVLIPDETIKKINKISEKEGRSFSAIVCKILIERLDDLEK